VVKITLPKFAKNIIILNVFALAAISVDTPVRQLKATLFGSVLRVGFFGNLKQSFFVSGGVAAFDGNSVQSFPVRLPFLLR